MPTPDPLTDPDRWAADLLRRLERRPLDLDAWRDLCREYGLVADDADDLVVDAWAALLLEEQPQRFREPKRMGKPTRAMPGTPLKVQVLRDRAARGQSLWHAGDQTLLAERLALICDAARHNGRSQVIGVVEEGPDGLRRVG